MFFCMHIQPLTSNPFSIQTSFSVRILHRSYLLTNHCHPEFRKQYDNECTNELFLFWLPFAAIEPSFFPDWSFPPASFKNTSRWYPAHFEYNWSSSLLIIYFPFKLDKKKPVHIICFNGETLEWPWGVFQSGELGMTDLKKKRRKNGVGAPYSWTSGAMPEHWDWSFKKGWGGDGDYHSQEALWNCMEMIL